MKQQSKSAILSSLDQTTVPTAIPKIVQGLNGLEHPGWVFKAYISGSTVTVDNCHQMEA